MTIPARAHFCWIGTRLPWAYAFAVLSAAERSELSEIVLHHTDALDEDALPRRTELVEHGREARGDFPAPFVRNQRDALGRPDGEAHVDGISRTWLELVGRGSEQRSAHPVQCTLRLLIADC